jgi:hypothetical protein
VLSVQAPVQAMVAILMTYATGGTLPPQTMVAIGLVVAGEYFVAMGDLERKSSGRQPAHS